MKYIRRFNEGIFGFGSKTQNIISVGNYIATPYDYVGGAEGSKFYRVKHIKDEYEWDDGGGKYSDGDRRNDPGKFGYIEALANGEFIYHYVPSLRYKSSTEKQDFDVASIEEALELTNEIEKDGYDSEESRKKRKDVMGMMDDFLKRKGPWSPNAPRRW